MSVCLPTAAYFARSSMCLMSWVSHDLFSLKPCWRSYMRPCPSRCLTIFEANMCSRTLQTSQTYPRHREEEPQHTDCHKTSGRQLKENNQLYLPHQDDCKTRWTQSNELQNREQTQNPINNGSNNKQYINNNRTTALERTAVTGGLNAFYWYQIFALVSVVVKTHTLLSSHGGFLTIAMYHHRETT